MIILEKELRGRDQRVSARLCDAFTLAEVVIALAIVATIFGGIIAAYTQASRRVQWSGYSLAAQAQAIQQLEQCRAGIYDPAQTPVKNDLTNFSAVWNGYSYAASGGPNGLGMASGYTWTNLDLPTTTNLNYVRATNYITVSMLWVNNQSVPAVNIQMVRVDTVWPLLWGGKTTIFTNSVAGYYAPDN